MADTLPPEVLAKLERSAQVVGGVNRHEGEPTREASAPRAELIPLSDRTPSVERDLWWDGAGWTRRAPRPGEVVPPVDMFDVPIPEREAAPGWDVMHTRYIDRVGYPRSGVVFDTDAERIDPDSGEIVGPRLHAAGLVLSDSGGVSNVEHLVLAWPDDIESATPPRREHIAEVVTSCARLAARKRHAGRRAWLLGVASRLEGCAS